MTERAGLPDPQYYKPLSGLKMWPDNYNKSDVGMIAKSIVTHGFRGAVRVWQDDMVIANNHVTLALMSIKAQGPMADARRPKGIRYHWPPIGVIEVEGEWYIRFIDCSDMSYTEATAFAVADNEIARQSTRDELKLVQLLTGIYQENTWLGESTGIDGDELDHMIAELGDAILASSGGGTGAEVTEDAPPQPSEELLKKWPVERGQMWEIPSVTAPGQSHRVLCGDSCSKDDVARLMHGREALVMVADPPYGDAWVEKAKAMRKMGYGHHRSSKRIVITGDNVSEKDFEAFLDEWLSVAVEVALKPPASVYIWHGSKRLQTELAMLKYGMYVHQTVAWVKPCHVFGRMNYHPKAEYALHGWLKGEGRGVFYGERSQVDLWESEREGDGAHPTQKPVMVYATPIKNHLKPGEVIYDPFLGSGTAIVAAEQLGCLGFGVELEPAYMAVTLERLANLGLAPKLCPDIV